jgi:hypothetical protein
LPYLQQVIDAGNEYYSGIKKDQPLAAEIKTSNAFIIGNKDKQDGNDLNRQLYIQHQQKEQQ